MNLKTHHVAASLILGAFGLGALAWMGVRAPTALATCSTGANIVLATPSSGSTLHGSTTLTASTAGSNVQPQAVTFLITAPNQLALGDVTSPSGSGGYTWSFSWDSRTVPDGSYQFAAVAHYGTNSTYDCLSSAVPAQVYNSSATGGSNPTLSVSISPGSWQGVPGQVQQFSVAGIYTDPLGQQHPITASSGATFQWGTNAGQLSTNGAPAINLIDGPATGSFFVGITVHMAGLSVSKQVAVKIVGSTSGGPGPSGSGGNTSTPTPSPAPSADGTSSTAPLTPQQITMLQSLPTIFRPAKPTNSDPVVPVQTLGCLLQKLGAKYNAISAGQLQPSLDDKLLGAECFSGSSKIPSTLAPVEPSHITELPTGTGIVTLSTVKNETISSHGGSKITAILIGGTGTPSSSVFLYFFSDPMVLRAQTDSQGKWTYVLENPLTPGHHEVYAVSQKESASFVRTPAVPVSIAAAAQGGQDGSLIIEHSLQPVQIAYIAGSAVMVLAGLVLLMRVYRRRLSGPASPRPAVALVQPQTSPPPTTPAPPPAAAGPPPEDHVERQ